jgi:NAD(P) transhydrogenase subunit beta
MGIIIGGVTFSGSLVAYRKLQGKQKDKIIPGQQFINLAILIGMIALGVLMYTSGLDPMYLYLICLLTIVYGVLFVLPIGGADMPVVISLLNSLSGIAGIFTGLLFNNMAMITGGILVGASGIILTVLMCKAMNRSLMNVIIGAFSANKASADAGDANKSHKEVNVTDAAIMCYYSSKVMVVPGYGMAVAQAQHIVHEVDKLLEANGVEVKYAIHPVAGRMPGHMNVLLAEADVPYPKLLELEDANNEFKTADVVLIIGANDVVNPAANDDPSSPIYGMPVLNVGEAKNVIIFKRSMNPGYAGIENPLFFKDNSRMLFGDAKKMLEALATEIKNQ